MRDVTLWPDAQTNLWVGTVQNGTWLWNDGAMQRPFSEAAVGTVVRVLFEDRELTAAAGSFTDDFRGADLYERYGGGPTIGYGDTPVALHIYEVPQ